MLGIFFICFIFEIVFAIFEGKGSSRKVVGKEGKFKVFYDIFK